MNDKQNLSIYYYFNDSTLFDPYSRFQAGGASMLNFGANTAERYQQFNVTHNFTINKQSGERGPLHLFPRVAGQLPAPAAHQFGPRLVRHGLPGRLLQRRNCRQMI